MNPSFLHLRAIEHSTLSMSCLFLESFKNYHFSIYFIKLKNQEIYFTKYVDILSYSKNPQYTARHGTEVP